MKLNIGENIRRLRRAADMTQEQLADKMGVAYQSVSRWENGTTYPDIEFLPALSGIFGVTVDELIGCEESLKKERLEKQAATLESLLSQDPPDLAAALPLVREMRRDCETSPAFRDEFLGDLLMYVECNWKNEFQSSPEFVAELRMAAEAILKESLDREVKDYVILSMACIEEEEKIEAYLDRNGTRWDRSKDELLYERYKRRKCDEKAEMIRQKKFYLLVTEQFCGDLLRVGEGVLNLQENLQINTTLLTYLHNLCGVTPDAAHPVSGDGAVDIFVPVRIDFGIRRACYLAATGDTEGAFVALEDTVSLLERFMSMEEGSELSCSCRWLRDFRLRVEHSVWLGWKERILRLAWDPYHYYFGGLAGENIIYPLTADHGWEWFDPIRNDPRFASYVERVKAAFTPDTPTE